MDWKEIFPPVNLLMNIDQTDEEDMSDNDSGIASRYDCCTPAHSDITLPFNIDNLTSSQTDGSSNSSPNLPKSECEHRQYAMSFYYQHWLSVVNRACELLQSDDNNLVIESAIYLFELSRDSDNCLIIATSSSVLPAIVTVSKRKHPNQLELTHCLAGLIHYISQTREGLEAIANHTGCVDLIITNLESSFESVLFYAVTSLHNLLLQSNTAKSYMRSSPCATSSLVRLLKISSNKKFHAVCMDCLQILAYCHEETKLSITRNEGIESVFNILSSADYEKLIWTSVRLLKVLSVCEESKRAILTLGPSCLDVLGGFLDTEYSPKLRLNVLWTLRNLSDVAVTTVKPSKDLLHRLILCLDEPAELAVSCVAGILANFTCRNQENKSTLVQLGSISAILRQFSATSGACISPGTISPNFLEPALCCLRHLTAGHQLATTAALYITSDSNRLHVVTSTIAQAINKRCSRQFSSVSTTDHIAHPSSLQFWELCRVWLGLVRNLSFFSSSLCRRHQDLSLTLADVTSVVMDEIDRQETTSHSQIPTAESKKHLDSFVNVYELLELCCITLSNMEYGINSTSSNTTDWNNADSSLSSNVTSSLFAPSLWPPITNLLSRLLSYSIKLSAHSRRDCTDSLLHSLIKLLTQQHACSIDTLTNMSDPVREDLITLLHSLTSRPCCEHTVSCPIKTWSTSLLIHVQRWRETLADRQSSVSIPDHSTFSLLTSNC